MAAVSETSLPALVDLRQLRPEELEPLLEEETLRWQRRLDWDFRPSADLVRRFVRMQALNGYALVVGRRTVGYAYFVCEERKGLIGDLYVMEEHCTAESESRLLAAVLRALFSTPHISRVESQLMMLYGEGRRKLPYPRMAEAYRRNFMVADLSGAEKLAEGRAARKVQLRNWTEQAQDEAARLIARAYSGHIDGRINDQYRSVSGARRFLMNIVQYPGCGSFFQPASWTARDAATGRMSGLSLASLVAFDVGHITQICVDPACKGTGVGYEMLRQSMRALRRNGCRSVSLTVTESNREAVQLYERLGFATDHRFDALVWENPA